MAEEPTKACEPKGDQSSTKIFIGNLPVKYVVKDLEDLFAEFGSLKKFEVVKNFAFAFYSSKKAAESAITALNDTPFEGVNIKVQMAKNKAKAAEEENQACFECGGTNHKAKDCFKQGSRPPRRPPPQQGEGPQRPLAQRRPERRYPEPNYDRDYERGPVHDGFERDNYPPPNAAPRRSEYGQGYRARSRSPPSYAYSRRSPPREALRGPYSRPGDSYGRDDYSHEPYGREPYPARGADYPQSRPASYSSREEYDRDPYASRAPPPTRDPYSSRDGYSRDSYPNREPYSSRDSYPGRDPYPSRDSYSGRESYPPREPYPQRDEYSRDPYPSRESYAPRDGYSARDAYGARDQQYSQYSAREQYPSRDEYGGREPYSSRDSYPTRDSYSAREPYPSREGYSGGDSYPSREPYPSRDSYAGGKEAGPPSRDYYGGYDGGSRSRYADLPPSSSRAPPRGTAPLPARAPEGY